MGRDSRAVRGYDALLMRYVAEWDFMQSRFFRAMAAYAVLALMATFTLDGKVRLGVWIFLAGLAVKTLIHYKTSDL